MPMYSYVNEKLQIGFGQGCVRKKISHSNTAGTYRISMRMWFSLTLGIYRRIDNSKFFMFVPEPARFFLNVPEQRLKYR